MDDDLSPEYRAALDAHNVALASYRAALALYRDGKMSDAEFLAWRGAKTLADQAFDQAFDAERARGIAA